MNSIQELMELSQLAMDYEARTGKELGTAMIPGDPDTAENLKFVPQAEGVEPLEFDTPQAATRYMLIQLGVLKNE